MNRTDDSLIVLRSDTSPDGALHPVTLRFADAERERAFALRSLPWLRIQSRVAILVGLFLYALYGVLDVWFVPLNQHGVVWAIRLAAMSFALAVFLFSFHHSFARASHPLLALTGLDAGIGLLAILWMLPVESVVYYYTGLVLVTFWTYMLVGARFIYALAVDFALLAAYNVIFGGLRDFPLPLLANHDFFIVSANLIGGFAGYMLERHRRKLFVQEYELEQERRRQERRALHDWLTGLPNRELLEDRLQQAITLARRDKMTCSGFYVDLDNFKSINDTYGHDAGDQVLMEMARRLNRILREADTVARLGGDEFFALTLGVESRDAAARLGQKILDAAELPLDAAGGTSLSVSIGICLFPYPDCTPQDIVHRADRAMYVVKHSGKRGIRIYEVVENKIK